MAIYMHVCIHASRKLRPARGPISPRCLYIPKNFDGSRRQMSLNSVSRDVCVPLGTARIVHSAPLGASTSLQFQAQTPE